MAHSRGITHLATALLYGQVYTLLLMPNALASILIKENLR